MDNAAERYAQLLPLLEGSRPTWDKLIGFIGQNYEMQEKWDAKKPSSNYRNELKYQRGGKTLVTLYLREGYFEVNVVFGKGDMGKFVQQRDEFSPEIRELYDSIEICHGQKWLFIEVRDDSPLEDIFKLLLIKRKPSQ